MRFEVEAGLRPASIDFAACSPLNIHCRLAGNHDFAKNSPIYFSEHSSPPTIFTVRTTRRKINDGQPLPALNSNFKY